MSKRLFHTINCDAFNNNEIECQMKVKKIKVNQNDSSLLNETPIVWGCDESPLRLKMNAMVTDDAEENGNVMNEVTQTNVTKMQMNVINLNETSVNSTRECHAIGDKTNYWQLLDAFEDMIMGHEINVISDGCEKILTLEVDNDNHCHGNCNHNVSSRDKSASDGVSSDEGVSDLWDDDDGDDELLARVTEDGTFVPIDGSDGLISKTLFKAKVLLPNPETNRFESSPMIGKLNDKRFSGRNLNDDFSVAANVNDDVNQNNSFTIIKKRENSPLKCASQFNKIQKSGENLRRWKSENYNGYANDSIEKDFFDVTNEQIPSPIYPQNTHNKSRIVRTQLCGSNVMLNHQNDYHDVQMESPKNNDNECPLNESEDFNFDDSDFDNVISLMSNQQLLNPIDSKCESANNKQNDDSDFEADDSFDRMMLQLSDQELVAYRENESNEVIAKTNRSKESDSEFLTLNEIIAMLNDTDPFKNDDFQD